jgi:4-hydroxybenzoate polyprenyltransferase
MKIVDKIRYWLQIFRAQTAAAVFMYVLTAYLVAGGELFSWFALILALWSILTHHISFGHNTVMDTFMGWDEKDPNKTHHPLIANKIKKETALKVIAIGMFFGTIIAILLVYYSQGNVFYAMAFLSLFIISGLIYNDGISKVSVFDFIPYSICFSSLTVFSYFLVETSFNELIILLALYIGLLVWFQSGISGEIKEIEFKDEVSLLQKLGTKCSDGVFDMGKSIIYPWIIKLAGLGIAGYIVFKYSFSILTISLFIVLSILAIYFCYKLTKKRVWNRQKTIKYMSLVEIVSIFMIPLILSPMIGLIETAIIVVISILYFVGMNSFLWKTRFAPKV